MSVSHSISGKGLALMLIRLGYDLRFSMPAPVSMVAMLHVHPSRRADLLTPDTMQVEPKLPVTEYHDSFGNLCSRISAPQGPLRVHGETLIRDSGKPDPINTSAREHLVEELLNEVLVYLAEQPLLRGRPPLCDGPRPFRAHRSRLGACFCHL